MLRGGSMCNNDDGLYFVMVMMMLFYVSMIALMLTPMTTAHANTD